MTIPFVKMNALLERFANVFPLVCAEDFVSVWSEALKDFDERELICVLREKRLKRRTSTCVSQLPPKK